MVLCQRKRWCHPRRLRHLPIKHQRQLAYSRKRLKEQLRLCQGYLKKTGSPHFRQWENGYDGIGLQQPGLGAGQYDGSSFLKEANDFEHARNDDLHGLESMFTKDYSKRPRTLRELAESATSFKLQNARQSQLPTDVPIISHTPDVPIGVAEQVGKTVNSVLNPERLTVPGEYVRSIHVGPMSNAGGNFIFHNRTMNVGGKAPISTAAHETQHALDKMHNPEIFKGYPPMSLSDLAGPPKGYWSHPSEVRARTRGSLVDFLMRSEAQQQLPLDPKFLWELEEGKQKLYGGIQESADGLKRYYPESYDEKRPIPRRFFFTDPK